MKNLAQIRMAIREQKEVLAEKFNVESLSVFGSYLMDEQNQDSDIDILVEFDAPIDLFEFVRLENFLCEKLGIKVDLVTREALKPRIRDRILREAVSI